MNWESSIDIYTLPCVKQLVGNCYITQGAQSGTLWQPRGLTWGGGMKAQEGEDITHIVMADSCCMAETSTILYSNYLPIKN